MGTGGHNPSFNGQDYAVVQAAAGQMAQLDLRVQWLSPPNNVRVTVDGGEETVLQGTVLPPEEGGGRRFRSKAGGRIQVMLVTDKPASLSFVSLAIRSQCADASGCNRHGSCTGGNCTCSSGYSGIGAWPTVSWQLAAPSKDVAHCWMQDAKDAPTMPAVGLMAFVMVANVVAEIATRESTVRLRRNHAAAAFWIVNPSAAQAATSGKMVTSCATRVNVDFLRTAAALVMVAIPALLVAMGRARLHNKERVRTGRGCNGSFACRRSATKRPLVR